MNNIIKYIKENKKISDLLFYMSEIVDKNTDISIWIRNEYKQDLKKVKWIYLSKLQDFGLIGIENINKKLYVVAIDTQGEQVWVNNFQDIPYEIIRLQIKNNEKESVKEYFDKYPESEKTLNEYETWCKDNRIELEPDNIYHDGNGNMFTHYFET